MPGEMEMPHTIDDNNAPSKVLPSTAMSNVEAMAIVSVPTATVQQKVEAAIRASSTEMVDSIVALTQQGLTLKGCLALAQWKQQV
eukprot:c23346_g1_i2 orf=546-800(+)